MSSHESSRTNDSTFIKDEILTLGVGPSDLAPCQTPEDEYQVILRKSADLKNFTDPREYGYASRIRRINRAQDSLRNLFESGEIRSFSDYLLSEDLKADKSSSRNNSSSRTTSSSSISSDDVYEA